ncbi:MAG TPA: zinc metallopeptidase, partial [Clostridia bacterium]|nr:zinc metallopeptidase [Clostridia bacterium]
MGWLYFDQYYLIFVVPALIFSIIMQVKVKRTFAKFSQVSNSKGLTGELAAKRVLFHYGINDVAVERVGGNLTDHYDPRSNVIRLSENVYDSTSVAAVGIACHEAGHAAQHAHKYLPIKIRNAVLPVANIGSTLGLPLAILGYFMGYGPLITIGLLLYALIAVFQIVTLPVEFNASRRAVKVMDEDGMLFDEELYAAKKVLSAAALTYVAALAVT